MSNASGERRVLLMTADLMFRAKLEAVVRQTGAIPVRAAPATLAVVELRDVTDVEAVRALVSGGTRVVAFAPHVRSDVLDAAREAGAVAVPNARVARAVEEALGGR